MRTIVERRLVEQPDLPPITPRRRCQAIRGVRAADFPRCRHRASVEVIEDYLYLCRTHAQQYCDGTLYGYG